MHKILVIALLGAVAGCLARRVAQFVQRMLAACAIARVAAPTSVSSAAAPAPAASSRNRQQAPAATGQQAATALAPAAPFITHVIQAATPGASSSRQAPTTQQQHHMPAAVQAAAPAAALGSPPDPDLCYTSATTFTLTLGASPPAPGSPGSRRAGGMPHLRLKSKLEKTKKIKLDLLLCNSHTAAFSEDVSDLHWGSVELSYRPLAAEAKDLLRVLLMQPCFMQTSIISKLMCSCKAAGTAVDEICTGYIPVHLQNYVAVDAAQQFAGWVAKHGHLLHSLQVGKGRQGQAAAIAAGLRAAAAAPNGLRLQQFHSTSEDISSAALISLLPPAHLTSLEVYLKAGRDTQQMAAAMLQLGQLRRLTVAASRALQPKDPAAGASPVLSALPGLSQLSSLHLQRSLPADAAASILEQLPASLVELRITQAADGKLTQLRLHYAAPTIPAAAAVAVSAETGAGWVALAPCLRVLTLAGCMLSAPVVWALAQLTSLSSLSLAAFEVTSSIAELGSAIKQLSSLQELEVEGSAAMLGSDAVKKPPKWTTSHTPCADLRRIAPAVVALKQLLGTVVQISNNAQLRSLRLFLTEMPPVAALEHAAKEKQGDGWAPWVAYVAQATKLTRLALGRHILDGMCNKWFATLAPQLKGLRDLRLQRGDQYGPTYDYKPCRHVTYCPGEPTLQSIATHLQQLTCLDLPDSRLHERQGELKPLASLKQLRVLGLDDKSCMTAHSAAAMRRELGLPGPLSARDARQWLCRPDEGW
ncbi:hypothetical protein COO60DRAFT_1018120 [Scenedesmus sp. NREL 46B-D3]|nr:hypothetical protein COO60DRAFT_1018120 [Scenedesmus sp. NREL 46B-D3]